jgi:hypothetical protein
MNKVTAIMGWFTEVSISVSENESEDSIKARLAEAATQRLLKGDVLGPDVAECDLEHLVDR